MKFINMLWGGDINVYSMARAFHQEYGIKSTAYGKYPSGPCFDSNIINYITDEKADHQDYFLEKVLEFAKLHEDKKIFLIGCGDNYVELCANNLDKFPDNVIAPYINSELMQILIHKERFYEFCDKYGLDYPSTFIHKIEMGKSFNLPFEAPFIVKPANSVMYWNYPYDTQKKVYKADTKEELDSILDDIYGSGYKDSVIIQDFIPGDDSYMYVLTNYSDKNNKVKFMLLGHVLLEEHTPHGIGNHATIINDYKPELCGKIKEFLDAISFTGFSNFDIKYDQRDGKYKVFEINVRQGRSNFYVTGSGHNLAKLLVQDRLYNQLNDFEIAMNKHLWTVVPDYVLYNYISSDYHSEIKSLIKEGKSCNPLLYSKDTGLKRKLRLYKNIYGHIVKFKKYYEKKK